MTLKPLVTMTYVPKYNDTAQNKGYFIDFSYTANPGREQEC